MNSLLVGEPGVFGGPHLSLQLSCSKSVATQRLSQAARSRGRTVGCVSTSGEGSFQVSLLSIGSSRRGVCLVWHGYPDFSLAGHSGLAATAILGPVGRGGGASVATGLTGRRGCLGRFISGPGLLTMLDLQLDFRHFAGPGPRVAVGRSGRAGRHSRFTRLSPTSGSPLTGTGLVPLLGSVGAGKAGIGSPAFLVPSCCGSFHGLPYVFLEDPPVSPSKVSDVVLGGSHCNDKLVGQSLWPSIAALHLGDPMACSGGWAL